MPPAPPPPHGLPPPGAHLAAASHTLLLTRQGASAFNQPLSWDTSKVTNMGYMFHVRSARALAPKLALRRAFPVHAAFAPPPPHCLPPPGAHLAP